MRILPSRCPSPRSPNGLAPSMPSAWPNSWAEHPLDDLGRLQDIQVMRARRLVVIRASTPVAGRTKYHRQNDGEHGHGRGRRHQRSSAISSCPPGAGLPRPAVDPRTAREGEEHWATSSTRQFHKPGAHPWRPAAGFCSARRRLDCAPRPESRSANTRAPRDVEAVRRRYAGRRRGDNRQVAAG